LKSTVPFVGAAISSKVDVQVPRGLKLASFYFA